MPFMEGLTCCALARYHRVTQDPEVLRAISVGIDQMIRECWVEEEQGVPLHGLPAVAVTPYACCRLSAEAMAYEAR